MNKFFISIAGIVFILGFIFINLFANIKIKSPKVNMEDLIYNNKLYLSNVKDNIVEHFVDELRLKIISQLDRLVVIEHTYKTTDSLDKIAKMYGTDVNSIRSTNYIEAVGLLYNGKRLIVHNKKGVLYKLSKGESLDTVAKKFKRSKEELLLINNKPGNYEFQVGEYIFVPNAYLRFKDFMLPMFNTKITSGFGQRMHPIFGMLKFHEGIDLKQKYGTPVRAACDGKVIFSGWAEGYGKLVILKHHKGYTTYYGHLSKIRVKVGNYVFKGQIIGNVGSTGWTTGPHLHFEVRKNGIPIDPRKVLF
ncbi:MAG: LysM peptidoglycan-binding domain-containing M23 family metallopeptidase [Endomicrobiia bacterium]